MNEVSTQKEEKEREAEGISFEDRKRELRNRKRVNSSRIKSGREAPGIGCSSPETEKQDPAWGSQQTASVKPPLLETPCCR